MTDEMGTMLCKELRNIAGQLSDIAHNTSRIANALETYEENHDIDYSSDIHHDLEKIGDSLARIYQIQDERL